MKTQLKKAKLQLKQLANEIANFKSQRKSEPNGYVAGLGAAQYRYRHLHIARCMARGRTYEQIENKVRENNKPDMDYVNFLLEAFKEDSKAKLYVVVREDLSKSQQAVQAGHAIASFLKKYPNTLWQNGTLVYLKSKHVEPWFIRQHDHASFQEPDLKNQTTAFAVFGHNLEKYFKGYELV